MPPISLLIKPASSNCNLRCRYCFYHSIAENRQIESYGMMSLELLENIVAKALGYADQVCTFAFQGGEPTLAGLDFYKKLVEFEKKYNAKSVNINNAIQTNGVIIDEEWARFFKENNFLVGISIDGPPKRYAAFFKNLFDFWYEDFMKGHNISIRYFDNLVGMFMGYRPEACGMLGECQCQFVIEADGGVYPCDFYVIDEWALGNIKDSEFDALAQSDKSTAFRVFWSCLREVKKAGSHNNESNLDWEQTKLLAS